MACSGSGRRPVTGGSCAMTVATCSGWPHGQLQCDERAEAGAVDPYGLRREGAEQVGDVLGMRGDGLRGGVGGAARQAAAVVRDDGVPVGEVAGERFAGFDAVVSPGDEQEQRALAADGVAQACARYGQQGFLHRATTDLLAGRASYGPWADRAAVGALPGAERFP